MDINSVPVFFSYGLTSRITVTATFETQKQIAARNLSQQGFYNQLPFVSGRFVEGYGDTIITGKYRLQRRQGSVGGISISGFVKIPTADVEKGLGTGEVDGGLDLIFTSALPWRFLLHSSMGVVATRDAVTPTPLGIKDEMRTGIGVLWPADGIDITGGGIVQGVFEYVSTTFIGAGSPNDVIQASTDLVGGLRWVSLGTGMVFNAGYRRNRSFDKDFPGNTEYDGFHIRHQLHQAGRDAPDQQLFLSSSWRLRVTKLRSVNRSRSRQQGLTRTPTRSHTPRPARAARSCAAANR